MPFILIPKYSLIYNRSLITYTDDTINAHDISGSIANKKYSTLCDYYRDFSVPVVIKISKYKYLSIRWPYAPSMDILYNSISTLNARNIICCVSNGIPTILSIRNPMKVLFLPHKIQIPEDINVDHVSIKDVIYTDVPIDALYSIFYVYVRKKNDRAWKISHKERKDTQYRILVCADRIPIYTYNTEEKLLNCLSKYRVGLYFHIGIPKAYRDVTIIYK